MPVYLQRHHFYIQKELMLVYNISFNLEIEKVVKLSFFNPPPLEIYYIPIKKLHIWLFVTSQIYDHLFSIHLIKFRKYLINNPKMFNGETYDLAIKPCIPH